ncbi:hypothetical protein ACFVAM_01775 [Streptomyces californicus]|uniref:hypothetical protein n=1 Tax=Streptomyces californicus TaxID=67351 RepID=UPI0036CC252A
MDYDPEDVQFSARTDDGDVVMYLPEITYLDTQQWSVEIGLTPDRLVQLRDALDNHLRDTGSTANRVDADTVATVSLTEAIGNRGQPPTVVARQATTVTETVTVAQQATVPLRERLRAALRRHIDPDDDTMPALFRGGFVWISTDEVLDDLIKAVEQP